MRALWWFTGFLTLVIFVAAAAGPRRALSQTDRLDPVAGLVGQQVTACNYNADLTVRVTGAEWLPVVADAVAPATEGWLILLIDVTNVSDKSEALTTRPLQLHAEDGRIFAVAEDPPDITDVARSYGVQPPWQAFDPGHTVASVVTFLVPAGAGPLTLAGLRDYC